SSAPVGDRAVEESPAAGRIIEARSGEPVAGLSLVVTFTHGDDGSPPLPGWKTPVIVTSAIDGSFPIPVPPSLARDARLKAHLQIDEPGYAPTVHLIEEPPDTAGRFPFTTLALRRARTARVSIRAPNGGPVARAPVRVRPPLDETFLGEDLWEEGRSVRPGQTLVRYTGAGGGLTILAAPRIITLEHPSLFFFRQEGEGLYTPSRWVDPTADPLEPGWDLLETRPGDLQRFRLVDREEWPVPFTAVEIELEGSPRVRITTDGEGRFEIAPRPYDSHRRPTFERPRRGLLRSLSPRFYRQEVGICVPSHDETLRLPGLAAEGMTLRLVRGDAEGDNEEGTPVPADQLQIGHDMTLVARGRDGIAELAGSLPERGRPLLVHAAGHLPLEVLVPLYRAEDVAIDLGNLPLVRGLSLPASLHGGGDWIHQSAILRLEDTHTPGFSENLSFDARGRARVSGLIPRHRYRFSLEGSRVPRVEGEFVAFEELLDEGITIDLSASVEEEVLLWGRVTGMRTELSSRYQVIERYFIGAEPLPLTSAPYPLGPEGFLGSSRILPRPGRAEALVFGPEGEVGRGSRIRIEERSRFDVGWIVLEEGWRAELRFHVKGLGQVLPPERADLVAERDANHELARMLRRGRELVVTNLLPGGYDLRWGPDFNEAYALEVEEEEKTVRADIERLPALWETVIFDLQDTGGNPVESAVVTRIPPENEDLPRPVEGRIPPEEGSPAPSPPLIEGLGEGEHAVTLLTEAENRVLVEARGFLPATVTLPAGREMPDPLVLRRPGRIRAEVIGVDGLFFHGTLEISWKGVLPAGITQGMRTVEHGSSLPLSVEADRGVLHAGSIPPGIHIFELADPLSAAKAELTLQVKEGRTREAGEILLEETRAISGTVLFADGTPAAGARVSLFEPRDARRLPQR
ncbi:MAG: hypothetical protein ACE5GW_10990, partial [Planctomycetota bacterium]